MLPFGLALLLAAAPPPPRARPATAPVPAPAAPDVDAGAALLLQQASSGEPPLAEVQRAASEHAATGVTTGATPRRARLAALLPKVSIELQHDDRRYHVVGLTSDSEVDYVRHTPGDEVSLRLSWDLGGVAFADAELRIADKEAAAAKARAEAVDRATKLYFQRRRLLLALAAAPAASPRERAEREVEIEELGGVLDALTGGLWSAGAGR